MTPLTGSPLNLLHLAKGDPNLPTAVPETDFEVQALTEPLAVSDAPLWLLLLEGELIIDLPHGDFRLLKVGDSVTLRAAQATLTPLEAAVVLRGPL